MPSPRLLRGSSTMPAAMREKLLEDEKAQPGPDAASGPGQVDLRLGQRRRQGGWTTNGGLDCSEQSAGQHFALVDDAATDGDDGDAEGAGQGGDAGRRLTVQGLAVETPFASDEEIGVE